MQRCFILNRVSTEKQKDNLSITTQRQLHPRIADQLGCTYTADDIFDLAVSSTTYDRTKWNAVKTAIASGRYAGGFGIFGDISRYHRDKDEWFEFLTHCLRQKITVVNPDTDRTTFAAGELIPIKKYDADDFKDLIQLVFEIEESQNFKRKFRKKVLMAFSQARDGGINIFGSGASAFGMRWHRDTIKIGNRTFGMFKPDEKEKKVVELIFTKDLAAPNMARWLNDNGFRTRTGKHWDATSVYRVREKLIYCGKMKNTHGDVIDALNIEPIVTYKQWLRAQHVTRETKRVNVPVNVKFALSGMTYCGLCADDGFENKMIRQTFDRKRLELSRMYCSKRKYKNGSGKKCQQTGHGFNMVVVLRAVNHDLTGKIGNNEFIARALRDYKQKLMQKSKVADIGAVRGNLAAVEKRIRNLTDAVADGFDRSVAINQLNALKQQRDDLNNRLIDLETPVKQSAMVPTVADVQLIYKQFLALGDTLNSELMIKIHNAFIDRIYLRPDAITVQYKYFDASTIPLPPGALNARKIDVPRMLREIGSKRTKDAAAEYDVSTNAIRYQMHKNGIKPSKNTKVDDKILKEMRKTHTVAEIAKHFNVTSRTIFNHLKKAV